MSPNNNENKQSSEQTNGESALPAKVDDANNPPIDMGSGGEIPMDGSQPWMNLPQQYIGIPSNVTPQQYYYMTLWLLQQQQQNGNKSDDHQKKINEITSIIAANSSEQDKTNDPNVPPFSMMFPPSVYYPFPPGSTPPNSNTQIPSLNAAPSQDDSANETPTQEKKTKRRGKNTSTSSTTTKSTKKRKTSSKESSASSSVAEESSATTPDTPKKKKKKETISSSSARGARGLRHFSMKVCELVQRKKTTTINDVADELVQAELQGDDSKSDDKNIRRRVYDALNVLMALNIISKDKKEIKWKGLPVDSQKECEALNQIKSQRLDLLTKKTQQLQELEKQHRSLSNLCQRNTNSNYLESKRIELPFIIVHTSKSTQIECEMDENRSEVFFNFDKPFEIHDDNEILYRLGLDQSSNPNISEAASSLPQASGSADDVDFFLDGTQPTSTTAASSSKFDSPSKLPVSGSSSNEKDVNTQ